MPSLLLASNSYVANSSGNTNFRAYGTAVSNAFANAGWVQASDTGQVDWTTAVANGTANASNILGYEIWRMNDALANDAPCYVKVEYFTPASYANSPGFRFSLGDRTDGIGNLTGIYTTPTVVRREVMNTPLPCYFVGSPSYLAIAMFATPGACTVVFTVERTKDAGGNDTAEGINWLTYGLETTTGKFYQQSITPKVGQATLETTIGSFVPPGPPATNGLVVPFFPVYFFRGVFTNPARNIIQTAGMADNGVPLTFTFYGQTCQFIRIPGIWPGQRMTTTANVGLMFRWD